VYLARLRHGAPVAVKVRRLRAFRQELSLLRRLHHPHIVKLLAYSDDHGASTVYMHGSLLQA
jgi:serine/threonine protein kinase